MLFLDFRAVLLRIRVFCDVTICVRSVVLGVPTEDISFILKGKTGYEEWKSVGKNVFL
jgi:hypothetical protein